MSAKALKMAARTNLPGLDLDHRITLMLLADRADDEGCLFSDPQQEAEMVAETTAVMVRLAGDPLVRAGVDNARVTRVVEALRDAEDEAA